METLTFGKYKNLNFDEIYTRDKQYLEWLNINLGTKLNLKNQEKI